MKALAQLVAIIVVLLGDGLYQIVDGERRWRAAKLLGWQTLRAVVLPEKPTAAQLHLVQLSIEAHRVALRPIERANLLKQVMEENGLTGARPHTGETRRVHGRCWAALVGLGRMARTRL